MLSLHHEPHVGCGAESRTREVELMRLAWSPYLSAILELPVRFELTICCLQGSCRTVGPEKHSWCLTRASNPHKNWFWISHVCLLHQSGIITDDTVAICFSATCFHVLHRFGCFPTSFCLSSADGTPTATWTLIPGLEDRCTIRLCYRSMLVRQPGFEPGMSRGLNPPYMPFYYKRIWYLRWESNPQKTRILSPSHMPFCYEGMLVSPTGFEPAMYRFWAGCVCRFRHEDISGQSRRSRTFATWSQATDTSVIRHPDVETGRIPIIRRNLKTTCFKHGS